MCKLLPALHLSVQRQLSGLYQAPLWFRLLTVTRAAFAEETAFRGYGFERLRELTGSGTIAAVATWALFTIAHLSSWGWAQVIIAAFGGLVLTVLYVWRRNLWANIIAHWLTDGAGFIRAAAHGASLMGFAGLAVGGCQMTVDHRLDMLVPLGGFVVLILAIAISRELLIKLAEAKNGAQQ